MFLQLATRNNQPTNQPTSQQPTKQPSSQTTNQQTNQPAKNQPASQAAHSPRHSPNQPARQPTAQGSPTGGTPGIPNTFLGQDAKPGPTKIGFWGMVGPNSSDKVAKLCAGANQNAQLFLSEVFVGVFVGTIFGFLSGLDFMSGVFVGEPKFFCREFLSETHHNLCRRLLSETPQIFCRRPPSKEKQTSTTLGDDGDVDG